MNHFTLYSQTGNIWFTAERDWKQDCCHSNIKICIMWRILCRSALARNEVRAVIKWRGFQLFCIITCRDILYFVFWLPYCHTLWHHQYLICIIQKLWISLERYKISQKWKHHSSSLLKAFQIHLFFNTSIFHFIGTLRRNVWEFCRYMGNCP